ncbi:MAG: undecaprenyl-diphosphatase UppP [Candidatus Omnitrophota bacterium]
MSPFQSLILGVVQGVTEFLPISSSGHLIIIPYLFGWKAHPLEFDVFLHLGTLCAIVVYFFSDWRKLFAAAISDRRWSLRGTGSSFTEAKLFWSIALATLPAVVAGVAFQQWAEGAFRRAEFVALSLGGFALVFCLAQILGRNNRPLSELGIKDALFIGCFQALAIFPGVSRSAATISAGLFLGLNRKAAVRFSFLLAAPVLLGAGIWEGAGLFSGGHNLPFSRFGMGFLAAFLSGLLSIHFILRFINRHSFNAFIIYRLVLCLLIMAIFF